MNACDSRILSRADAEAYAAQAHRQRQPGALFTRAIHTDGLVTSSSIISHLRAARWFSKQIR